MDDQHDIAPGTIASRNASRYRAWSLKRYWMEGFLERPILIRSGAMQLAFEETFGMTLR
jgi:hypothetical protein